MPQDDISLFTLNLERVANSTPEMFTFAMEQSLLGLESVLKPYPPQPDRNRAKTFNTYVRGIGRLPRSAFVTATGKVRKKIRTKGAVKTSERLGTRWSHKVEIEGNAVVGVEENTASYAIYVQGKYQPAFHHETGWITGDEAYHQQEDQIMRNFDKTHSRVLEELAKPSTTVNWSFTGTNLTIG